MAKSGTYFGKYFTCAIVNIFIDVNGQCWKRYLALSGHTEVQLNQGNQKEKYYLIFHGHDSATIILNHFLEVGDWLK